VDSQTFGRRIREARERAGLSQEELGAALGKDQGAMSEYESGKRRLSAIDLPTLAQALSISLNYFFQDETSANAIDFLLLDEFRQLPSLEAKQAAIDIIHILHTRFSENSGHK
jgi:transcriptional regulator with XRE-family HTH domain